MINNLIYYIIFIKYTYIVFIPIDIQTRNYVRIHKSKLKHLIHTNDERNKLLNIQDATDGEGRGPVFHF